MTKNNYIELMKTLANLLEGSKKEVLRRAENSDNPFDYYYLKGKAKGYENASRRILDLVKLLEK